MIPKKKNHPKFVQREEKNSFLSSTINSYFMVTLYTLSEDQEPMNRFGFSVSRRFLYCNKW